MPWPHSNDLGKNPPPYAGAQPTLSVHEQVHKEFMLHYWDELKTNEPPLTPVYHDWGETKAQIDKLIKDTYLAPLIQPSHPWVKANQPPVGPPIKKVFTKEGLTPHTHELRVKVLVEGLNLKETVYCVTNTVTTEFLAMNQSNPLEIAESMLDTQLAQIKSMIMENLKKESQK